MHDGWIHMTSPAQSRDSRRPKAPAPPPPPKWHNYLIWIGIAVTALLLLRPLMSGPGVTTLSYSAFKTDVAGDKVASVSIDANGRVTGKLEDGTSFESQIPTALTDDQLIPLLQAHHVKVTAEGPVGNSLLSVILSFLPFILLIGVYLYIARRAQRQVAGGIGGIIGSRAKVYDADRPATRFSDVAGYEGAKREVAEVVDFLKNPTRYSRVGAKGPRGVLLVGPPGTGKTLLARAVAGEAEVPFFSVTGSGFVELFVGVGAARVRDLFGDARKRAPSIVFVDEIDAIGQRRGGAIVSNDEREQTLNQLLAEMDGFDPSTGIVVIAATNRPEILDPALLRPGRFDRQVEIPLPNLRERTAILGVHTQGKKLGPGVDLEVVARGTPGFSGADLANLVNEAAIVAVRAGREVISASDFDQARDRIVLGRREATNALLPEEKRAVAVHESGHALVAALSDHADPVARVTILPAGQALGVTEQLPVDERHLYPESYLRESLAIRVGGRAAELIVLGEGSTGAANDLAGATQLATRMVREFGMSPKLGPVGFASGSPMYLGDQEVRNRTYAEATQRVIDEEVTRLLNEAQERATDQLTRNRESLDRLVELLIERESIDGEDVYGILGRPVPGARGESEPSPSREAEPTVAHVASEAEGGA
jgi:cell division protease FtsH